MRHGACADVHDLISLHAHPRRHHASPEAFKLSHAHARRHPFTMSVDDGEKYIEKIFDFL